MSVESETQKSGSVVATDYFPASKLFEYQWPLGDEGAEHYMLQEHVKEYLDIRGIQRKYPGQFDDLPQKYHPPSIALLARAGPGKG